jgi:hypothetical protein
LAPGQQRSPSPPQARQVPAPPPPHTEKGAVQPTSPEQHGWPILPQAPAAQPPAVHWVPFEQFCPAATHSETLPGARPSQHPPASHALPSQQGWPAPPQAWHWFVSWLQARPAAVQKFAAAPPMQQGWPTPPHGVPPCPPVEQLDPVALQTPSAPLHGMSAATHPLPEQQPFEAQLFFSQHGCAVPPQATIDPAAQTMPLADDSPEARQVPPLQQPPPEQLLPGQHAWPGAPQAVQLPPEQVAPPLQGVASATHSCGPGSQHPVVQVLCAQHG